MSTSNSKVLNVSQGMINGYLVDDGRHHHEDQATTTNTTTITSNLSSSSLAAEYTQPQEVTPSNSADHQVQSSPDSSVERQQHQEQEQEQQEAPTTNPKLPKRPKSAFMCFCDAKRQELVLETNQEQNKKKKTDVLEIAAEAWDNLDSNERADWEMRAREDKIRFEKEKADFKGPWPVKKRRAKKDASAPKRPMSAFLKFSKIERANIKRTHPNLNNTDVSRLLGARWRALKAQNKVNSYIEGEKVERDSYNAEIAKWREEQSQADAASRTSHHMVADAAATTSRATSSNHHTVPQNASSPTENRYQRHQHQHHHHQYHHPHHHHHHQQQQYRQQPHYEQSSQHFHYQQHAHYHHHHQQQFPYPEPLYTDSLNPLEITNSSGSFEETRGSTGGLDNDDNKTQRSQLDESTNPNNNRHGRNSDLHRHQHATSSHQYYPPSYGSQEEPIPVPLPPVRMNNERMYRNDSSTASTHHRNSNMTHYRGASGRHSMRFP